MGLRPHHYLYALALVLATLGLSAAAPRARSIVGDMHGAASPIIAATRTIVAEPRAEEPRWRARHAKIVAAAAAPHDVLLLGDSITQGWESVPVWQEAFPGLRTVNAGIASDRVEHLLWRVQHGALPGGALAPKVVIILIGVNNLAVSTPEHITAGVNALLTEVKVRAPQAKILLLGLFPTGKEKNHRRRARVAAVNARLETLADGDQVRYVNFGPAFLEADGSIAKATMSDYLHLTRKGYSIWVNSLAPALMERLH